MYKTETLVTKRNLAHLYKTSLTTVNRAWKEALFAIKNLVHVINKRRALISSPEGNSRELLQMLMVTPPDASLVVSPSVYDYNMTLCIGIYNGASENWDQAFCHL